MAELTRRYIVMPMATEAPFEPSDPDAVFVLKPWKDPAALQALETYRAHCYPELAQDLDGWINAIKAGPVVRGGVGERNAQYLASRPALAPAAAKTRPGGSAGRLARAKAKTRSRPQVKRQAKKAKPATRKKKRH